ncbi:helix-turn-helix transcriptional regulator [Streptomyces violascens]|uniref:helix-turn-helix transcriptional regulator n=1 Tax=Streptomyces violascens TaxID=67381 RepID=UPI003798FE3D
MAKPASDERLVDTAQICAEFGTHKSRISTWYNDRENSGFPAVRTVEGRRRLWAYNEVAAFFADREASRPVHKLPAGFHTADQGALLTTAEVSDVLGLSPSTVYWWLKNLPGYFPAPDENTSGMMWRRSTVAAWVASRPGKGRRSGSASNAAPLPTVAADGPDDELLGTKEAAALLGYKSLASFSSALYQGNLPELKETDAERPGPRGNIVKLWTRARIRRQAQARGAHAAPAAPSGSPDELLGAEEAAGVLGYSSAASLTGALNRGRLPELEEPDALIAQPGGRGRPQRTWKRSRLERLASMRAPS